MIRTSLLSQLTCVLSYLCEVYVDICVLVLCLLLIFFFITITFIILLLLLILLCMLVLLYVCSYEYVIFSFRLLWIFLSKLLPSSALLFPFVSWW